MSQGQQSLSSLAADGGNEAVVHHSMGTNVANWGWFGGLVLWFIVFSVLFWLIYYSLKPAFVLKRDSTEVDTAKVLLAAVVSALVLVIIVWLVRACAFNNRR